jgi:hypothetical protein
VDNFPIIALVYHRANGLWAEHHWKCLSGVQVLFSCLKSLVWTATRRFKRNTARVGPMVWRQSFRAPGAVRQLSLDEVLHTLCRLLVS